MSYLISQMLFCLLAAALLGFLVGWFWRRWICNQKVAELEGTIASLRAEAAQAKANLAAPVAAAVAPAAATAVAAKEVDALTRIEGIGPKIQKLLHADGVTTFVLLAATPVDKLQGILQRAGSRFRLADPTSWPDQAKLAAEGRWEELEELQDLLIAGRGVVGIAPTVGDDLKLIEGIGPQIEKLLKGQGVTTWAELAASPVERIQGILDQGGKRFRIADPKSWPDQAKLCAESRWKDLDEFQDILLGGRED
jgi:predicted flap endonuclease-1-like 5' DNA nuclease